MRLHALILLALTMSARLEPLFAEDSLAIQPGDTVGSIYGKPVTAADIGLTAPIDTALEFDSLDSQQWQLMGRIAQAFGKPVGDGSVENIPC
jgi:hypothetical protein